MHPLPLLGGVLLAVHVYRARAKHGLPYLIAGGIGTLVLLALGAGLVEFPDSEKLIADIGEGLGEWTYLLVGVMAYLETGAFVGLVAPGETAVLVGGVIAGQGQIDPVTLFGLTWACAVGGDVTSFLLGRRLGRGFLLRHGPRMQITEERLVQVETFFQRHGGVTILIGRFIGLIRALAPFVAGSTGLPLRRFLPYDVIGAGLWSGLFVGLGYVFWQSFDQVTEYAGRGAVALGTLIALVAGIVYLHRLDRDPEMRARTKARLVRLGRRPLLRPFVPLARRLYRPARFFAGRLTPGELGLELTTLLAVALVGSYVFAALAIDVGEDQRFVFDGTAFGAVAPIRQGAGIAVARAVTLLGSPQVVGAAIVAAAAYLFWRRRPIEALMLLIGFAVTYGAVNLAKAVEARPRPGAGLVSASGSSFPSAHAAYAIAYVAIVLAIVRARASFVHRAAWVVFPLVLAAIIGLTRVYLNVHYLSDVLAGWALGAAVFGACGLVALIVAFIRQNPRAP